MTSPTKPQEYVSLPAALAAKRAAGIFEAAGVWREFAEQQLRTAALRVALVLILGRAALIVGAACLRARAKLDEELGRGAEPVVALLAALETYRSVLASELGLEGRALSS